MRRGVAGPEIGRGPLAPDDAIRYAAQVAAGLSRAHESGVVHRDIKPANILITREGTAKIVDFGLAKLRGATKLTREGTTPGTVEYMSPEQARGEDVDHRTDLWSLGCLLYEMLTGRTPFRADYEQATIYSILHTRPGSASAPRGGVPAEVERIGGRCLDKAPADRYQSAAEVLADLEPLRRPSGTPPGAAVKLQLSSLP